MPKFIIIHNDNHGWPVRREFDRFDELMEVFIGAYSGTIDMYHGNIGVRIKGGRTERIFQKNDPA